MAKYIPKGFIPGAWEPQNGRPAYATDAITLDKYTTYLAAMRRPALPAIIYGAPIDVSVTHQVTVLLPQYTRHVEVWLLLCGRGDVSVTSDDSATVSAGIIGDPAGSGPPDYDPKATGVTQGSGLSGTHSAADAQWYRLDGRPSNPSAGDQNAIRVTLQSSPAVVTFSVTFTDRSGTESLKCYGLRFVPLPPDESDGALPA